MLSRRVQRAGYHTMQRSPGFSNMRFSTTNALAAIRDASLRNSLLDLQLETAKANRFVKDDPNSSFQVRQLPIYKAPWVAAARHSMRPLLHFLGLDLSLEFAFPWFASRYINALFISQSVAGMYYPQDPTMKSWRLDKSHVYLQTLSQSLLGVAFYKEVIAKHFGAWDGGDCSQKPTTTQ